MDETTTTQPEVTECHHCTDPATGERAGNPVCDGCAEDYVECDDCRSHVHESESTTRCNRTVCESCADDYVECGGCGETVPDDETVAIGRLAHVCESCQDANYCQCESCEEWVSNFDSRSNDDGDTFCDSCYCDRYITCEECGCEVHRDDAMHTDDSAFCESCYPSDEHQSHAIAPPEIGETGFLTKRAAGFELEVIGQGVYVRRWTETHDGSLSSGGREYVSQPMGGQAAIDSVRQVCDAMRSHGCRINHTCGYHLHIDATKESESAVANFTRLAKRMESWAFSVVPRSRHGNHYCEELPSQARATTESTLEDVAYVLGDPDRKTEKYNDARYCWVNIHSWYYRGTVEIRLHSGTTDSEKILCWAEVWLKLFDFAQTESFARMERFAGDAPFNAETALCLAGVRQSTIEFFRNRAGLFADSVQNESECA